MIADDQKHSVMCITQDGIGLSHLAQIEQLCAAGARWVQLRMKGASRREWVETARVAVASCRRAGALCVINDSVEVAIESGADGVHLGGLDEDWRAARRRLGAAPILGGTVNNERDARRALESGCLDYVGIGPWRFTSTKKNLSPVLEVAGVRRLISLIDGIPAWVIGGIEPADLPSVRSLGAAGVAVSSGLYRGLRIADNFGAYASAWTAAAPGRPSHLT